MALPTYQGSGTLVVGTSTVQPPWVAHAVDDVALLVCESGNEAMSLSDAQGFEEIVEARGGTGGAGGAGSTGLALFWARATSTSMGTPTVADPGDHVVARITTFRGARKFGCPFKILAVEVLAAADTAISIPGGTTTVPDCLIVQIVSNGIDSASAQVSGQANADLGSVTERSDNNASSGNGGGFCVTTGTKATAGAFGAMTATMAASSKQIRITLAVLPTITPRTTVAGMVG